MPYTLVALDVTGIQTYLFGSNRLVENIGASEIVAQATEKWLFEAAKEAELTHNFIFSDTFDSSRDNWFDDTKTVAQGNVDLEIMFAGGGNAVLMFRTFEQATKFIKTVTEKLIVAAPRLNMAIASTSFDRQTEVLKDVYDDLWKKLAQEKSQRQPSQPLLGLSVTAMGNSTGLPAIAVDKDEASHLLSPEIVAKLAFADEANERMQTIFLDDDGEFEFERDFNLVGEKIEANYLAVVHADGNGVGSWLEQQTKNCTSVSDNDNFIKIRREASEKLRWVAVAAMQAVTDAVIDGISRGKVKFSRHFKSLPLRPLVVSGDDTTFVCEGTLGLSLAVIYLKAFRTKSLKLGLDLHACAGVAITHSHYPFARSYALSEDLVKKAKNYVRSEQDEDEDETFSAIDWHFAVNGLIGNIREIRQQDYTIFVDQDEVALSLRPLRLITDDIQELRSWQSFRQAMSEFQADDWQQKRNKLKTLREILRDGCNATKQYLKTYQLGKLPELSADTILDVDALQETGFTHDTLQCGYFDAIEAVDHFIDLEATNEL